MISDGRRRFYLAVFGLFSLGPVHGSHAGPVSQESCAIDPTTIVSDACASFSTLDELNTVLQPSIKALTQDSDFFSYYRLNLYNKECPFWNDESGTCGNIACAVNTIDNEEDIPAIWRAQELGKLEGPKARHPDRQHQRETRPLMGELGADVGESCVVEYDDDCDERDYCVPEDESAAAKGDYVSLADNPERFTGYSGPAAHQVWEAIYRENCFSRSPADSVSSVKSPLMNAKPFGALGAQQQAQEDLRQVLGDALDDDTCLEKRVFYRIISGMHASISAHLCYDHLNQTTGEWGPNLACYVSRLHDYPDRISNLYFNYAVVLRALEKVRPALATYTFCSGDPAQDASTKQKVLQLADQISAGPRIYDESLMFADPSLATATLKGDFRARFRNVSRTMDCVGCDKCRLWGKLQTAGYGTALKILFEFDDQDPSRNPPLRRTELVALVNTLEKISHGLDALGRFEQMLNHKQHAAEHVRVAETEDDGFLEHRASEPEPAPASFLSELRRDFDQEFGHIYRVTIWVLKRWMALPGELLNFFIIGMGHFGEVWLGLPKARHQKLSWEIRYPPARDEV